MYQKNMWKLNSSFNAAAQDPEERAFYIQLIYTC